MRRVVPWREIQDLDPQAACPDGALGIGSSTFGIPLRSVKSREKLVVSPSSLVSSTLICACGIVASVMLIALTLRGWENSISSTSGLASFPRMSDSTNIPRSQA